MWCPPFSFTYLAAVLVTPNSCPICTLALAIILSCQSAFAALGKTTIAVDPK